MRDGILIPPRGFGFVRVYMREREETVYLYLWRIFPQEKRKFRAVEMHCFARVKWYLWWFGGWVVGKFCADLEKMGDGRVCIFAMVFCWTLGLSLRWKFLAATVFVTEERVMRMHQGKVRAKVRHLKSLSAINFPWIRSLKFSCKCVWKFTTSLLFVLNDIKSIMNIILKWELKYYYQLLM